MMFGWFVSKSKKDAIVLEGVVKEMLPNMQFKVLLVNGMVVTAYLCGKMRMKHIRVSIEDTVTVEMSPYDVSRARIVYRQR